MLSTYVYGLVIKKDDEILGICTNFPTEKDVCFKKLDDLDREGEERVLSIFKDEKLAIRSFNSRANYNCLIDTELADELESSLGIKIISRGSELSRADYRSIKSFVKAEKFELFLERR